MESLHKLCYNASMINTIYTIKTPVSIALVTDAHNHPVDGVLASLKMHRPEIICIAGDFVYAPLPRQGLKMKHSPYSLDLLYGCSRLAPTFVSIGNHEWMLNADDLAIIRSTGVTLLDNDYVHYQPDTGQIRVHDIHAPNKRQTGKRADSAQNTDCRITSNNKANNTGNHKMTVKNDIVIGGLSSASYTAYRSYCSRIGRRSANLRHKPTSSIYPALRRKSPLLRNSQAEIGWLDSFCQEAGYKILLCHHPEYYPLYLKRKKIDLILSGHAHGGQIRIFGQGLFAPGQGFLPRLTSGVIDDRLVISKGLANNTIVPRLFNPGELVYLARPRSGAY